MAEITSYAYMKVRDLFEDLVQYIELRDESGVAITRIPVADTRVTHVYNRNSQEQTYAIAVKGTDADIPVPSVFGEVALFETASSTDEIAVDTITPFQIYADVDELTITVKLQIPEVV